MTPLEMQQKIAKLEDENRDLRRELGYENSHEEWIALHRSLRTTTSESILLCLLRKAGGKCVSRERIADACGYRGRNRASKGSVESVDIFVMKLRRRLGKDAIETVWSAGYCLTPKGISIVDEVLAKVAA